MVFASFVIEIYGTLVEHLSIDMIDERLKEYEASMR